VTDFRRPGLLDAAVFAYTWTVLIKLREGELAGIIKRFDNLVRHANRLKQTVYPSVDIK